MEKFQAARHFLKVLTEKPDDFTIVEGTNGRSSFFSIQHITTGTRVILSISGKVFSYVDDSSIDLNFVDSDTAVSLANIAKDTLENKKIESLISKDNILVYKIISLYS